MYNEFDDKEKNPMGGTPDGERDQFNTSASRNNEDPFRENSSETSEPVGEASQETVQDMAEDNGDAAAAPEGVPEERVIAEAPRNQNPDQKNGPTESFYHYSYDHVEDGQQNYGPGQNQGGSGAPVYERPRKKKGIGSKLAVAASVALVFGVVSGAAFQITNYVGGKAFPETKQTEAKLSTTGTVNESNKNVSVSGASTDVAQVAQNAMPSIVSITNKTVKEVQNYFFGGSSQQEEESSGSGIIVAKNDTELLIATNNHVVEDAQDLSVCFTVDTENQEEKVVKALVKGTDPSHDLAVVAVQLSDIPSEIMSQIKIAELGDSDNLQVGQQAIAIGNALGYGQSLTYGVISALDRSVTVQTTTGDVTNSLIQTDAAINFGNSGGALLNINGQLIGINSVKAASTGVEGMGYAIPINTAKPILDELMNQTTREKVATDKQGYMGVTPIDVIDEVKDLYDLPAGAMIKSVQEGSPAEEAGLKKGDIITQIDGLTISSASDLLNRMQYYKDGETVELQIQSAQGESEKERTVSVKLANKSEAVKDQNVQSQQQDGQTGETDGNSSQGQGGYGYDGSQGIPDFFQFEN